MLEWAGLGAIMFALVIFCARIMRRGLTTLDDDRKQQLERIGEGKRKIEEDRKNIPASEQLYLAEAALRDLLRLDCRETACSLKKSGSILSLHTPDADWEVELLMRERSLRSTHKILHGQARWLLHGPNASEEHKEIATLMASLARHLHGEADSAPPEHLSRRLRSPKPALARPGRQK